MTLENNVFSGTIQGPSGEPGPQGHMGPMGKKVSVYGHIIVSLTSKSL